MQFNIINYEEQAMFATPHPLVLPAWGGGGGGFWQLVFKP